MNRAADGAVEKMGSDIGIQFKIRWNIKDGKVTDFKAIRRPCAK
jgi:hypothetical protein